MIVYRLEYSNGGGPYTTPGGADDILADIAAHRIAYHPPPKDDPILNSAKMVIAEYVDPYHFGFSSLNQALKWVPVEYIKQMYKECCFLYEFIIDSKHVIDGTYQTLFERDQAISRRFVSLDEIDALPTRRFENTKEVS